MIEAEAVSGSVKLTREQLYERVWQTPVARLAAEFGISDNGLRKICKRLDVPCPPVGWWAKKAAGHKAKTIRLAPAQAGTPAQANISPTPEDTGDLRPKIQEVARSFGETSIPERLVRPHPVIAGWIEDHRRRQEEARRERRSWPYANWTVADLTRADRRRHRLLNALFRTLEKHGAAVKENDRRHLVAEISDESIEFSCHEKSKQITRTLSAEEKRRETWNRSGVKKELEPTGRFEFQIRTWINQPVRKLWLETERQSLDAMMPEIVATFLMLGPMLAERTRQRAEERRLWEERQRQLEHERQRRQQDDNRWKRFVQIAEGWKRTELAREFIARLRELDVPDSEPVNGRSPAEWLDWAEAKASERDPVGQGLEAIIADVGRIESWTRFD